MSTRGPVAVRTGEAYDPDVTDQLFAVGVEDLDRVEPPPARQAPRPLAKATAVLSAIPNLLLYAGIALLLIGFVLIAVAWHEISPLLHIELQLPYLASAGFTGLGLVLCGIALIAIAVKQADARARDEQTRELIATQRQIRQALERARERQP